VPERFELSDEVSGGAFGVALTEVVAAEVAKTTRPNHTQARALELAGADPTRP
jgi:hypothetical protein